MSKLWFSNEVEMHLLTTELNRLEALDNVVIFSVIDGTSSRRDHVLVVGYIEKFGDDTSAVLPELSPAPKAKPQSTRRAKGRAK